MSKIIISAAAVAMLAAGVAPMSAQAQDHKAQRAGVVSMFHGSTITVTKTSTGGKGAFGHYWTARGKDRTTGVVSEKDHTTTVNTKDEDITAINACISNGILPATCSSPNSEY